MHRLSANCDRPAVAAPDRVPSAGRRVRVLACPGSVQLVTALAAARTYDTRHSPTDVDRYLVIHDLCAPAGQDADFARCLERLAHSADEAIRTIYLRPAEIESLQQAAARNPAAAVEKLRQWLGTACVDELYLSQNRLALNGLLARLFPDATKICYGDGIGVNFSPQYFAATERTSPWRSWRRAARTFVRENVLGRILHRPALTGQAPKFDDYYLLLPNRFDEIVPHCVQLEHAPFVDLFQRFGAQLDQTSGTPDELARELESARHALVLMTSNFSEAGKMSLDAELAAYRAFVDNLRAGDGAALVIKPHPRDSQEKMSRLRDLLANRFQSVTVLDDPLSFYMPFESIFAKYFLTRPDVARKTRLACVSSACLSFELLYGVHCTLGLGDALVAKHFRSDWVSHRLRHEHDLRNIVQEVRAARSRTAAA